MSHYFLIPPILFKFFLVDFLILFYTNPYIVLYIVLYWFIDLH